MDNLEELLTSHDAAKDRQISLHGMNVPGSTCVRILFVAASWLQPQTNATTAGVHEDHKNVDR